MKTRLSEGLLPDIELFKQIFLTILGIKSTNKV